MTMDLLGLGWVFIILRILSVKGSPTELPYIQGCCRESILSDAAVLLDCVQNASTYHFVDQSVPVQGSKAIELSSLSSANLAKLSVDRVVNSRFAFITFGDQKIASYSAFSFSVNEAFAEYNGYVMMLAQPDYGNPLNHETRDVRWNKVKILETAMKTWAREVEFLIWLDADLILLNFEIDLDAIVDAHPQAHVWACPDIASGHVVLNSGTLILRNSEYVIDWLLPTWWRTEGRTTDDQVAFTRMYRSSSEMREKVVIMPMDAFNSIPPASVFQTPECPVLHMMGEHNYVRVHSFTYAFRDICRAIEQRKCTLSNHDNKLDEMSSASHLARFVQPQFGANNKMLFAISMLVYVAQVDALLGAAHRAIEAATYIHEGFENQYFHLNRIFISVGKYAEALEQAEDNGMFVNETDFRLFEKGKWNSVDEVLWKDYIALRESDCTSNRFTDTSADTDGSDDDRTSLNAILRDHFVLKSIESNRAAGLSVMGPHPNSSPYMIEHVYKYVFLNNLKMLEFKLQQAEEEDDEESFDAHYELWLNLASFHVQVGIRHLKVQKRVVQNLIKEHSGSKPLTRVERLKLVDAPVTAMFKEVDVICDYLNTLMATSPPDHQEHFHRYVNEVRVTLETYLGDPNNEEDQRAASTDKFHRMYRDMVIKSEPYITGQIPAAARRRTAPRSGPATSRLEVDKPKKEESRTATTTATATASSTSSTKKADKKKKRKGDKQNKKKSKKGKKKRRKTISKDDEL